MEMKSLSHKDLQFVDNTKTLGSLSNDDGDGNKNVKNKKKQKKKKKQWAQQLVRD